MKSLDTLRQEFGSETGFDILKEAMNNVTAAEETFPIDASMMQRVLIVEEQRSGEIRHKETTERARDAAVHNIDIKRGKLRQAMEQMMAELDAEELRVKTECSRRVSVINRTIAAHDAALAVLKQRNTTT